jgi:small subunit ribosomal protein S16
MVVIRLSLRSRPKNNKHYQILVADQRKAPNKKFIERVGSYDPTTKKLILINGIERIDHWVSQGAQMTDRVKQILKSYKKEN